MAAVVLLGIVLSIQTSSGAVKIELSDPKAQVEVKVDGDTIDIAGLKEPLRLKLGEHNLSVTSGDYQSVSESFTVRRGQQEVVRVVLQPTRKEVSVPLRTRKVDEKMERELDDILAKTPSQPKPPVWVELVRGKDRVPQADLIKQAEEAIRKAFEARQSAKNQPDRNSLAQEAIKDAKAVLIPTHERFANLRVAAQLLAEAKGFTAAVDCCDELSRSFDIDVVGMKAALLWKYARLADTAAAQESLAEASLRSGFEAIALDDYRFLPLFVRLAKDAGEKAKLDYVAYQTDLMAADAAAGEDGYAKVKDISETLRTDPNSPPANLAVGKFLCFVKNDWSKGLRMIAAASDTRLTSTVAEDLRLLLALDQGTKIDVQEMTKIGDTWWSISDTQDQRSCRERAKYWYLKALGRCDAEQRRQLSDQVMPRIDSVRSRPVAFRIHVLGVHGGHGVRISNDGISSWSSHGTQADRVNHLELDPSKKYANCGRTRLFPNVIDFSSADVRSEWLGQWGEINAYNVGPDYVEIDMGRPPVGASDFGMTLTIGDEGFCVPDRFENQWHVKFYGWEEKKNDPTTKQGWETITKGSRLDELDLERLNFRRDRPPYSSANHAMSPKLQALGRVDYFAAVATREWDLPAGTYEIHTLFDDGIRVFVDDQKVVDESLTPGGGGGSTQIKLAGGKHRFRVEYWQSWGGARIKFSLRRVDRGREESGALTKSTSAVGSSQSGSVSVQTKQLVPRPVGDFRLF